MSKKYTLIMPMLSLEEDMVPIEYQYDNFQIISMFCEELLKGEIIYSIIIKKFKRWLKMVSVNEFAISTANDIPGFKVVETKGFIYGLTVRSRGAGGQIGAGIKSLFGGEIKQYVTMVVI